jgi:hypothetical protein
MGTGLSLTTYRAKGIAYASVAHTKNVRHSQIGGLHRDSCHRNRYPGPAADHLARLKVIGYSTDSPRRAHTDRIGTLLTLFIPEPFKALRYFFRLRPAYATHSRLSLLRR